MPWNVNDNSPAEIRELLARHGLALKKRWGQNFMISANARASILEHLDPSSTDRVWEIGPGLGAITAMVLSETPDVTVFEIDWGLIKLITQRFGSAVRVVPGDAVETIPENTEHPPNLLVGNLPYRSAAAIITTILETDVVIETARRLVFTVQQEMAVRIAAAPSSKDYSPLSVLCQMNCHVKVVHDLGKGHFFPSPEVVSSIVVFEPERGDQAVRRLAALSARSLFSNRRKTIANNVGYVAQALDVPAILVHDALVSAGINERDRAEVIAPTQFLELAKGLAERAPELLDPELE